MSTSVRSTTLADEARFFVGHRNAQVIAGALAVALVARFVAGAWAWSDLTIAVAIVALQPFSEWVIHVFVLHYKPVTVLGRTIDFDLARKHRDHHADPTDVELVFIPFRSLLATIAVGAVLFLVALPTTAGALTGVAAALATLLVYEWTHYLIHSRYRPRTRAFRYLWRAHRLHHYKNERYWFGVTNPAADHLLGTSPAPGEVETSPTARSLV